MFQGIGGLPGEDQAVGVTLYTDAFVVRGTLRTRQRRVTDILNDAEHQFLVLTDVVMDEYGSRNLAARAEYAQVNLAAVLFAVADTAIEPLAELRTPKVPEQAMITIPPFRIVGRIHLLPERNLRDALAELTGRFVPVTDAYYWSDTLGEARTSAPMVAFNHARAQILAPHREVDPWEGLSRGESAGSDEVGAPGADAIGSVPEDAASTSRPTGPQDPWARGESAGGQAPRESGVPDPWGFERQGAGDQAPSNPWGGPGGDPWGTGRRRDDEESQG